jgi:hypothetical protein
MKELDAASDKLFLILYDISGKSCAFKAPLFGRSSPFHGQRAAKVAAILIGSSSRLGYKRTVVTLRTANATGTIWRRQWEAWPKPPRWSAVSKSDSLKAARILILPPPRKYR